MLFKSHHSKSSLLHLAYFFSLLSSHWFLSSLNRNPPVLLHLFLKTTPISLLLNLSLSSFSLRPSLLHHPFVSSGLDVSRFWTIHAFLCAGLTKCYRWALPLKGKTRLSPFFLLFLLRSRPMALDHVDQLDRLLSGFLPVILVLTHSSHVLDWTRNQFTDFRSEQLVMIQFYQH